MTPIENLLVRLPQAKKVGNSWSARCPAHDDRRPSLSIDQGDDGTVLVKCHAGCETSAILAAVGLELRDLFPPKLGATSTRNGTSRKREQTFPTAKDALLELERRLGQRSASWTYHDADGNPVGLVVRWNRQSGKDIRPVSRHVDGWRIAAMPDPRPLYRLPDLATARRVIVCEGEKAADAARSLGLTATTSAGGSQAADKSDWRPLRGKEVWILPDNDAPGRKYADTLARILAELTPAPVVRIVELPDLPDGGDVADWIDSHGDAAEPDVMRAEVESLARVVELRRICETDDLTYRPFPLDVLPEPINGFVEAGARAIGCDPCYLALPLLTAIAAAIGNTRRLELKRGWLAPPILWSAIVGESGTAKSPAFRLVMQPVRERQLRAIKEFESQKLAYEASLEAWQVADKGERGEKPQPPTCERFSVSDTTMEALAPILQANPRGLLLARDELAGWIGSFDRYVGKSKAGADSANWLSMFNAESIIVDRKTGIPRMIHVRHAAVCVTGGIQPATLKRALGQEHRESGLAARLLLTFPPRKPKQWTDEDIDPDDEAELVRLFDRLYELKPNTDSDGEPSPEKVRLSSEAKKGWTVYYNTHALEPADLTGDLSAAWSKLEEYAARLALVVHCTRWAAGDPTLANPGLLDVVSMNAGITLATWFKHEARRVYALLDESDAESDQRQLIHWIGHKGGTVTPREVQQGCRWLKEPGAAEIALQELVKAGRGTWRNVLTTTKGGRPSRCFVLSTSPIVHETRVNPIEPEGFVDVDSVDAGEREPCDGNKQRGLFGGLTSGGPYREGF